MTFVPLSPIPLKDRTSMIFLQYGQIDVLDGAFVLIDKTGIPRSPDVCITGETIWCEMEWSQIRS